MTTPPFTHAPWHVIGRAEEFTLAVAAERPGNSSRLDSVLGDENAEANAKLIAAAPDLYDALDVFVREYVEMVNSGDCGNWNPETEIKVKDARAALAKARGENP